ncbi:MAG: aspartate/glutamate racemase family protein [Alphaproteobacteria bacterium]
MKRILVLNPNTVTSVTALLAGEARLVAGDRAEILEATAPFGAGGIESQSEGAIAAHAVLTVGAEHQHVDAIIVAAFMDPGLDALREISMVPAVGLCESGVRAASVNGRRFALVSLGPAMRPLIERIVAGCGATDRLVSVRYVGASVPQMARDRPALLERIVDVARAAEADGAEAILFGGAVFAGIHREIGHRLTVPLVDGIGAATEAALAAPPPLREDLTGRQPAKPYPGVPPALARLIDRKLNPGAA